MKNNISILTMAAALVIAAPVFAATIEPDTAFFNQDVIMDITCDFQEGLPHEGWELFLPNGDNFGGAPCENIDDSFINPKEDNVPVGISTVVETSDSELMQGILTLDEARLSPAYVNEITFEILPTPAAAAGMISDLPYGTFAANTASVIAQVFPVVALSGGMSLAFMIATWLIDKISKALGKEKD